MAKIYVCTTCRIGQLILQVQYQLQQHLMRSAPGRKTGLATDLVSHSTPSAVVIKPLKKKNVSG